MSTQTLAILSFIILTLRIIFCQQPATFPTDPIYSACYPMDGDPPCNNQYYVNNLGCDWDNFDMNCMCIAQNDNINVIYLIDISTSASPLQSDFTNVAELLQDVTDSTLNLRDGITTIYNQYILYDNNQYPLPEFTNARNINIDNCCGTRTELNDLSLAINSAIQQFNNLSQNKNKVLVIFNGQQQSDYLNDDISLCPIKSTLNDQGIYKE